ncbi:binuclear zinc transcription factor [Mucor ambiguus]|uniref:Binuclear zinc transcription factor n=1 Tax=Mucor ambiguus TaxID=91626 RepID=A0A0C9N1R3_9FUNG|nr:binuclear zinc transcription factor [Mucor ambiguus]
MEVGGLFSLRTKSLSGSKRIKISRACDECRKRKVKCDGVQPCSRCRKSNAECVFAKLPPKRGPPKQYMENLENRLQRVEKALKSMASPIKKMFDEQQQPSSDHPQQPNLSLHDTVSYSAPYTSDMTFANMDRFTINEIGQAVYVNDLKERSDRIPTLQQQQHHYQQQQEHSNDTLSEIASLSDQSVTTTTVELPVPDHLSSRAILKELQPLTEIYFEHVHKYVPMIHKPSFLKQMHSTANSPSRLLVYAMCAVAARWSPDTIANADTTIPPGYAFYQKALDLLDEFIDSPRIGTVQALVLLVKYQEYYQRPGYFHRSYTYLHMASQMCNDLGLGQLEGDSYDIEAKRRTFWATFMYDLLMSIEQGHATYFDVHKCTTGFPLVTGEEGPALEELITNQNIFIQLGKVLSDIYGMVRRIYSRQRTQGDSRTQDQIIEEQARLFSLHTHLENFLYEMPPSLIYAPTQDLDNYPAEKQPLGDPFIGFLHMTYHFSVILLHRTYATHPPPETEHKFVAYPHRKLCAISASNITGIADVLLESYPRYVFSYPTRGVQHTIHCLAMACTIHKYEMAHADDESMRESARLQYILSVDIIQKLSSQSPSAEFSKYYSHPLTATEKRMSAPVHYHHPHHHQQPQPQQQPLNMYIQPEKSKVRRNTLSSVPISISESAALYQSSASITDPSQLASLMAQQEYANYQQQQQQQQQHMPISSWNQQSQQSSSQQSSPRQPQIQLTPSPQQGQSPLYYANNESAFDTQMYPPPPPPHNQADMMQPPHHAPNYLSVVPPNHPTDMVMSPSPVVDNSGGRIRRHTFSNSPQQQQSQPRQQHPQHIYPQGSYYSPNVTEPIVMMQNKAVMPSDKQPPYNVMISPITTGMGMMMTPSTRDEDAIMMDPNNSSISTVATLGVAHAAPTMHSHHQHHQYDPTSGMSQLYLTDDQQQQQQQQIPWEGSIVSDSGSVQRSEGHVMK